MSEQYCNSVPAYRLHQAEQQLTDKDAEIAKLRKVMEALWHIGNMLANQEPKNRKMIEMFAHSISLKKFITAITEADNAEI